MPALALGAAVAGVAYVLTDDGDARPLEATGATSNEGAPVAPVGGVSDYVKVYIAQRVKAIELFGEETGSNNKAVPRCTREYAIEQVIRFWEAEINRLCGLSSDDAGIFGVNLSNPRVDYTRTDHPGLNPNPLAYRGVVSFESAQAMVENYNRRAVSIRHSFIAGVGIALPSLTAPLTLEGADEFWSTMSGVAVDVDVDRATPNYTGGAYVWSAIVESAQELPGRVGEAARDLAATVGKGALAVVWGVLEPLVTSPWVLGAAAIYVYLQRAELLALARRFHV